MKGRISLESEPGKGSTFSLSVAAPAAEVPSAEPAAPQPAPAESMKILMAEDHKVNQYLIVNLLRNLGHTPIIVESGVAALTAPVEVHVGTAGADPRDAAGAK